VCSVTVSPATPPVRRLVITLVVAALLVALGLVVLSELGVGASIVPFALAVVCLVDAEQVRRRYLRQRAR
jgi:flagellar biosynthesis protein FliP